MSSETLVTGKVDSVATVADDSKAKKAPVPVTDYDRVQVLLFTASFTMPSDHKERFAKIKEIMGKTADFKTAYMSRESYRTEWAKKFIEAAKACANIIASPPNAPNAVLQEYRQLLCKTGFESIEAAVRTLGPNLDDARAVRIRLYQAKDSFAAALNVALLVE